jgi:hypothetical protein
MATMTVNALADQVRADVAAALRDGGVDEALRRVEVNQAGLTGRQREEYQRMHAMALQRAIRNGEPTATPLYTLTYVTANGPAARTLDAAGVERVGEVVSSVAARGAAWDVAVYDAAGADVTFGFACFR